MLDKINKYKNNIIQIKGHDNPDVDSFVAGLLVKKLLEHNGFTCKLVAETSEFEKSTVELMNRLGIDVGNIISQDIDFNLPTILVDHYTDAEFSNIIACIDHHPTESTQTYQYYLNRRYASASQLILTEFSNCFEKMEDYKELVYLTIACSSVDTSAFKSSKALPECVNWCDNMADKYNFNRDNLLDYGMYLNDLSSPISELATCGMKTYNYNGVNVGSSYIQVKGDFRPYKLIKHIQSHEINGYDFWVFMVYDMQNGKTDICFINNDRYWITSVDSILSRGSDIMPKIEPVASSIVSNLKDNTLNSIVNL